MSHLTQLEMINVTLKCQNKNIFIILKNFPRLAKPFCLLLICFDHDIKSLHFFCLPV
jgi:hypothetical protein